MENLLRTSCVFLVLLTIQGHILHFGTVKLTVRMHLLPVAEETLALFLQSRALQLGHWIILMTHSSAWLAAFGGYLFLKTVTAEPRTSGNMFIGVSVGLNLKWDLQNINQNPQKSKFIPLNLFSASTDQCPRQGDRPSVQVCNLQLTRVCIITLSWHGITLPSYSVSYAASIRSLIFT